MKASSKFILTALFLGASSGAFYLWRETPAKSSQPSANAPAAIPVVSDTARQADVPIVLSTIGTVQAFNTVTVRARVDGQLEKVALTEGQDVKAGDVLAQIDPRPFQAALEQAQAAKARDEAQLANAKRDLQRFTDLKEFASRQSVDTQNALVAQLGAALQGDQAAIDNAQVQLGYTKITAPLSGRTGARLVDQGNMVRASEGTGLLVITQLQPISVIFTLPQDVLDQVSAAMARGHVPVEAYKRDDSTKLATGTLALIDNQIDVTTGTMRLKATFPNQDRKLWPGQFVNIRVQVDMRPKAVTVPAQVMQRGAKGMFAYVIKPDLVVEPRPITVGQTREGTAIIESGLTAGETVVLDGQYKLKPGAKVSTVPRDGSDPKTPAKTLGNS